MENILNRDGNLLGRRIEDQYQNDFDSLPAEEQAERITNYIIKHKDGKKSIEKLIEECKLEYNITNGCKEKGHSKEEKKFERYSLNTKVSANALAKDAAALCQLTYACDPNRAGDNLYHTDSKNWIPYIPSESSSNILSIRMQDYFDKFENDNRLKTSNTNYTLKEKWEYGTFRGIFTGDIDLLKEFDKRISRKRTGFFSMLYYRDNGHGLDLAYVTAGTTFNWRDEKWDSILDNVLVNFGQGLSGLSPQHTLSIQNAKILHKFCSTRVPKYNLYFFGHSLGGGMAIANGLATGCETIVFNNAGLNILRNCTHNRYNKKEHNITAYFTDKDFLSTEKENKANPMLKNLWRITPQNIGKRIYLGTGGHGIEGICQAFCLEYIANKNQIVEGI